MKITSSVPRKDGTRSLTVRLGPHETIVAIDDRSHYRLGGQVGDIVASYVIVEAAPTHWCSIEQKWAD